MVAGASAEAKWFVEQVQAGTMSVEAAREAIAIPESVRAIWAEASAGDAELAGVLERAANLRRLIGERFEELLLQPVEQVREAKIVKRSVRHGARLPVFADKKPASVAITDLSL